MTILKKPSDIRTLSPSSTFSYGDFILKVTISTPQKTTEWEKVVPRPNGLEWLPQVIIIIIIIIIIISSSSKWGSSNNSSCCIKHIEVDKISIRHGVFKSLVDIFHNIYTILFTIDQHNVNYRGASVV